MAHGGGGHHDEPKRSRNLIVWLIIAAFAVLGVFLFNMAPKGAKQPQQQTSGTTVTIQEQLPKQAEQPAVVKTTFGSVACPETLTLTIPGSDSQEWSEVIKPGNCDVIFMDNPSTIKRRYRYTGGTWSEDQHENRVGFDEAQYQNTASESIDMRIEFRPGS